MLLSNSEAQAVQHCLDEVLKISEKTLPSNPVILHGSRSTGLAGPLSDFDFVVTMPEVFRGPSERGQSPNSPKATKEAMKVLFSLSKAMKETGRYQDIEIIYGRVKLLKALDIPTGLTIQFSVGLPVVPAREFTHYYLSEFPHLRAIHIVLRHALLIRGLATVFDRGIGSYSLLIMIVTALKHCSHTFERDDVASQLLYVLDFWAKADTYETGYAADPARTFKKYSKGGRDSSGLSEPDKDLYLQGIEWIARENWKRVQRTHKPEAKAAIPRYALCLQDPANPYNDLGAKALAIKHIQKVFEVARNRISSLVASWDSLSVEQRQSDGHYDNLLGPLVKARYSAFLEARARLKRAKPGGWQETTQDATSARESIVVNNAGGAIMDENSSSKGKSSSEDWLPRIRKINS